MNHEIDDQARNYGNILYKEESYTIQGAFFEVYPEMGVGFLEPVYQECLERELASRGVPFIRQILLAIFYKGDRLGQTYKPDLNCYDKIIVESKAAKELDDVHRAQPINILM